MNRKIVIDAGHGGEDPGALGNGITEKNMTLAISEYMYDRFRELGIPVKLTRNSDETVNPSDRVNRILEAFGNDKDVIVISNHINAGGANGKNVGKVSSVLFALKYKDFGLMLKFFFMREQLNEIYILKIFWIAINL